MEHWSWSIPFEVLHEDDWHLIVFNQCKILAKKSQKPWRSSTIAVSGVPRFWHTTSQAHIHYTRSHAV